MNRSRKALIAGAALLVAAGVTVQGSSHREAPGITGRPKLDGTDFYMFRSYEPGRQDYVTLIANYVPLQDAYGGPNFFTLDPRAVYEIHVDNNGDAREDLTFQFGFHIAYKNIAVPAGGVQVPIPLINAGPIGPGAGDTANLNVIESYSINLIRGNRGNAHRAAVTNAMTGSEVFRKPVDRIGDKSIADYPVYAGNHVYDIDIPECASNGKVFVGQRREGFVVNLAEAFDLVNLNPLGPVDGEENVLADKNITSLALEVPISCLTNGNDPVIGAWTTASSATSRFKWSPDSEMSFLNAGHGKLTQVSRLGMPLVNELVIGIGDKDDFNASEPKDDGQFATYVTNPTLPVLIQALFGVPAPATPRNDLVQVFLTGVPGLNQPQNDQAGGNAAVEHQHRPRAARRAESRGSVGRRPGRLPERAAAGRRRGGHRAARGRRDPAAGPPPGDRRAERRSTLDGHHRLYRGRCDHAGSRLRTVPPRVPVSANTALGVRRPDAPVVGGTVGGGW